MEITEVRVERTQDCRSVKSPIRALASVVFDGCFAVHDLKIIEINGRLSVFMPDRKLTEKCPSCDTRNHRRANFCNWCGNRLRNPCVGTDPGNSRESLYADIAHPTNRACREVITQAVLHAYGELQHPSPEPEELPPW